MVRLVAISWLLAASTPASAVQLKPETLKAFDAYIQAAEARLDEAARSGKFLWVEQAPDRLEQAGRGQAPCSPWTAKGEVPVPSGLIHDWVGAVFVPGVSLDKTLAFVQDYDRHKVYYKPEVTDSKLVSRNGNDFKIYYRLLKKKVLTVVLNTGHDVHYIPMDKTRCRSRSRTTRIAEVQNPGKPDERELPAGEGQGFLWRLNSYWRFQEKDGGVYVECEAISLTRSVPAGLGWLIDPIIRSLPRESLANTLRATRDGLTRSPKE